jgi:hypothetical protein
MSDEVMSDEVMSDEVMLNSIFKNCFAMKTKFILSIPFVLLLAESWGQDIFYLKNPSFEADAPGAGVDITGWKNLGAADQTPPDIQPGWFGVRFPAQHGKNYLGLAVRETNTWEGVGQRLDGVLQKDSAYIFSLWLSRSNEYISSLAGKPEPVKFNAPTILKIWGYNTQTGQEELLAESMPVGHSEWVFYEFVLSPTLGDYDEIDLMAYYAPGFEYQNGNLLIDDCSAIEKID